MNNNGYRIVVDAGHPSYLFPNFRDIINLIYNKYRVTSVESIFYYVS